MSTNNTTLKNHMLSIPKADLHIHLNGAVPTETVQELICEYGISLPEGFNISSDLQILHPVNNLEEYFKPWHALTKLPHGKICLKRMICAAFKQLVSDNVTYIELRNSPFYISNINHISLQECLEWLIQTIKECSQKFSINARLILSISRFNFDLNNAKRLLTSIKKTNFDNIIVGMDLSGNEDTEVPHEVSKIFRAAKEDLGLGITIHAGETGNLLNIEWAVEECCADRIAHGLAAADSPQLLEKLHKKNICIETCLTSNLRTGYVKHVKQHPVQRLIECNIPFVLCSDNPAIHGASLSDDYALFSDTFARTDIIDEMFEQQKKYAFWKEKICQ